MSIKKQYNKTTSECKVTFRLPKEISDSINNVGLAGEFNNWDPESNPMKKLKSGEFTTTVNLEKGKDYQFKYVIEGKDWINDQEADKYVSNGLQGENSVVSV